MEKFIPFRLDGWVPHVPSDHHVINVEFFPDVAAPSRSSDTCLLFGVFGMYQKKNSYHQCTLYVSSTWRTIPQTCIKFMIHVRAFSCFDEDGSYILYNIEKTHGIVPELKKNYIYL
jgi:hypothetical protein